MSEPRRVDPRAVERLHRAEARRLALPVIRAALAAVEAYRRSHPARADAEPAERMGEDAAQDLRSWVRRALEALPILTPTRELADRLAAQAEQIARLAGQRAALQMTRLGAAPSALLAAVGVRTTGAQGIEAIDITATDRGEAAVARWIAEGLDLVSTYPRDALDGVELVLRRHAAAGTRWETIRDALQERVGMTERHATMVARDQVGKLQGRITADLHAAAGIRRYRWRTSRDQRVRSSHARLEGSLWDADGPGAPGAGPYGEHAHPGEAIQCRCYREPVVDDLPSLRRPVRGVETVPEHRPVPRRPSVPGAIPRATPLTQQPRVGPLRERGS